MQTRVGLVRSMTILNTWDIIFHNEKKKLQKTAHSKSARAFNVPKVSKSDRERK